MTEKQELQKRYSNFSTHELLEIIDNKHDYTETAVIAALEEVAKRNISEEEIKSYKEGQIQLIETYIKRNLVDDLSIFQKIFFFFLWLPFITFPFKRNYEDDGYVLKLKQATYYGFTGFLSLFLVSVISVLINLNALESGLLWVVTFLISFMYDEKFNRLRLVQRLQKQFGQTEEENEDQS